MIHLAASSGPARRPTASPSPAPATQSQADVARPTPSPSPAPATQSQADIPRPNPSPSPAPATQSQAEVTRPTASPSPAPATQSQNDVARPTATPSPAPVSAPQPMAPPPTQTEPKRKVQPKPIPFPPRPQVVPTPTFAPRPPSPSPSQSYSQPPTIGSSQNQMPPGGQGTQSSQSSMIDPQLLDDTQTPGAGPSRSPSRPRTTAEIAMQLVADIASLPAPAPKKRSTLRKDGKPRKKYTRTNPHNKKRGTRDPSLASGTDDGGSSSRASITPGPGESENGNGSERGSSIATTKKAAEPRPRKKPKQRTPEYDEDGNVIRKPRGPYKSRGRANTEHDRRLSKFRKARSTSGVPGSTADEEVDPFAEEIPIDPELMKMGSFASNFYDGDMTERAIILKNAQRNKQEEARKERLEFERMKRIRLQPLRRRERAKRNEDRAQRRLLWEEDGAPEGEEEVSDDEIDSTDEEYEFEPDRLTPPGSPDPNQYDEEPADEEEGIRPDEARPEDEDDEEGLGLDVNAYDNGEGEGEEYDEEVMPQTNLADWGFNVTDDADADPENADQVAGQGAGDPNEPEPDYSNLYDINPGEEGEYDDGEDGAPGFSFADYSANMENRRTQALATQNSRFVVQEDDDETRMINSVSWQKRERTDKWTDDETDFFYSVGYFTSGSREELMIKVLGEVGENYTMMKAFFPGRTVAQIKKKGIRENAKNPEKVTAAINARRPIGMSLPSPPVS
jgi:transcription factor TFIIIB component B''